MNCLPHRALRHCVSVRMIAWWQNRLPDKRKFHTRTRHAWLCCRVQLCNSVSYIDQGWARKTGVAETPWMAKVLASEMQRCVCCITGALCVISSAYGYAVLTHLADHAIRSSTDASCCSESYLPSRRDGRCRMMFGGHVAMFRKLVEHSMRQWCVLLRCDLFARSHVQERKSAKMLKCRSVRYESFKTNGCQNEVGADTPGTAISAACTVVRNVHARCENLCRSDKTRGVIASHKRTLML